MTAARVRCGKPVAEPYDYRWRSMPVGTKKVCPSPIDAVFEVLMHELRISSLTTIMAELGVDGAHVSRVRHRKDPLPHTWLLRAMVLSGIPYKTLCAVCSEEPQYWPHANAWGTE